MERKKVNLTLEQLKTLDKAGREFYNELLRAQHDSRFDAECVSYVMGCIRPFLDDLTGIRIKVEDGDDGDGGDTKVVKEVTGEMADLKK